jgi:hypothetical protein
MTRGALVRWTGIGLLSAAAILVAWTSTRAGHPRRESQIERASHFLAERSRTLSPAVVVFLGYILREHDIQNLRKTVAEEGPRACRELAQRGLGPFCRLLGSSARVTLQEIESIDSPIDRLTARALHCKALGIDDRYESALHAAASSGCSYELTHSAIALRWIRDSRCAGSERLRQVADIAADRLVECVILARSDTDLGVEALVALQLLDRRSRIEPDWLKRMLSAQREDGGWGSDPHQPSYDHTTTLALWAMLLAKG